MTEKTLHEQWFEAAAQCWETGFMAIEHILSTISSDNLRKIDEIANEKTDTNCVWYELLAVPTIRKAIELRLRRLAEGAEDE